MLLFPGAAESTKKQLHLLLDSIPEIVEKENRKIKEVMGRKLQMLFDEHQNFDFVNTINMKKRKADVQIQNSCAKLRKYYEDSHILPYIDEVEVDEMFDDWDWSSDEWDNESDIETETHREIVQPPDTSEAPCCWNDFNFWRLNLPDNLPDIPDDVISVEILNGDLIGHYHPDADDLMVEADPIAMAALNIWCYLDKRPVYSKYFSCENKMPYARRERQHLLKRFNIPRKKTYLKMNLKQPRTCY